MSFKLTFKSVLAPAATFFAAKDVQAVGIVGPGGHVALPWAGRGAARSDKLPRVALAALIN